MIRLRQIQGADAGRELEFNQDLIRVGRMPDSEVNFDPEVDLDASGRHAEIRNEDGRYLLIDTGSRNGTWLNGQRIKHVALGRGDEIEFGRGGPKVVVTSVENRRPSREPTARVDHATKSREPKFDPLAMPVTTATRLEDLVGRASDPPDARPARPTREYGVTRKQVPRSWVLWAALAAVVACAIGAVFSVVLQ
ncbi:MAG: FHA domain-containing protein [Myxococcota bacterium]